MRYKFFNKNIKIIFLMINFKKKSLILTKEKLNLNLALYINNKYHKYNKLNKNSYKM